MLSGSQWFASFYSVIRDAVCVAYIARRVVSFGRMSSDEVPENTETKESLRWRRLRPLVGIAGITKRRVVSGAIRHLLLRWVYLGKSLDLDSQTGSTNMSYVVCRSEFAETRVVMPEPIKSLYVTSSLSPSHLRSCLWKLVGDLMQLLEELWTRQQT